MQKLKQGFATLQQFSAFLLVGTIGALIWANIDFAAYLAFVESPLLPDTNPIAHALTHGKMPFSLHFIVNDIFMVLFFGIAMKEVTESFLPGGALSSLSKAAMPVIATAGGVLGPIAMFFTLRAIMPAHNENILWAWAVPTATDIAYCWMFARIIFGAVHPAVTFLLVLAVLDDLIGMMIIATAYTPNVEVKYLGFVVAAIVICEAMRRFGKVKSFWPYFLIGAPLSWYGLHGAGVHAALALVPVVPFMPHAERDAGLFASDAQHGEHTDHGHHSDTLNQFEHFFKPIVDVGLLFFGLANAGVILSGAALAGTPTWIIFLSLLLGKTIGIYVFSLIGTKAGLSLPKPMKMKQVLVLGCVAGIGFTVALFVTGVAMPKGNWTAETVGMLKLGALMSFAAGGVAFALAKVLKIQKLETQAQLDAAVAAADAA